MITDNNSVGEANEPKLNSAPVASSPTPTTTAGGPNVFHAINPGATGGSTGGVTPTPRIDNDKPRPITPVGGTPTPRVDNDANEKGGVENEKRPTPGVGGAPRMDNDGARRSVAGGTTGPNIYHPLNPGAAGGTPPTQTVPGRAREVNNPMPATSHMEAHPEIRPSASAMPTQRPNSNIAVNPNPTFGGPIAQKPVAQAPLARGR